MTEPMKEPKTSLEDAFNKLFSGEKIPLRNCSMCREPIGYVLHPEGHMIGFDSSCGCASSTPIAVDIREFVEKVMSGEIS